MFKCELCNREFNSKLALYGHNAHHVKRSGLDIIKAKERGKIEKEKNILRYLKNPEKCTLCSKIIEYNMHIRRSNDRKKNYKEGKNYNPFCSRSCSATYTNTHKTKGCVRSKLELFLEGKLETLYPNIDIHFNRKDAINSELDIYIPSLKLAFELNGIFHYEAIFGADKLDKIKNNDQRKFQACLENNIELCIIDSSKLKYFKEINAKPYLDIICGIINKKLTTI